MVEPRVEVVLDGVALTPDIRETLLDLGAEIRVAPAPKQPTSPAAPTAAFQPTSRRKAESPAPVNLRQEHRKGPCDHAAHPSTQGHRQECVANCKFGPVACRSCRPMDNVKRQLRTARRREAEVSANYRALFDQVLLASQLQRDLLAGPLPRTRGLAVDVLFEPIEPISGDMYSVHRLDETHVGIALVDATGHGLPAALLAVYVMQLLKGKETEEDSYRLIEPREVIDRLQSEMLASQLQECQFLAALYAVYDEVSRKLTYCRAGTSYPILVRNGETPRRIVSEGPIVGAFPHATFETVEVYLEPGDRVLFHSDGLDALLLGGGTNLEPNSLEQTTWFRGLGDGEMRDRLDGVRRQAQSASTECWDADDITILALEATFTRPNRKPILNAPIPEPATAPIVC